MFDLLLRKVKIKKKSGSSFIRTVDSTVVHVKCCPLRAIWSSFQSAMLHYLTNSTVGLITMFQMFLLSQENFDTNRKRTKSSVSGEVFKDLQ